MSHLVRLVIVVFAGASALSGAPLAHALEQPGNTMEIVIGGGPHAGTYKPPPTSIICMDAKKQNQFTAAYKDFNASDPKTLSEAVINISNPAETGPKQGDVLITFGDPDKKPPMQYTVSISRGNTGPLTFTRNGKGADVAFQGQTKDGISLHFTARCTSIDVL
jgi:hypothetical protein